MKRIKRQKVANKNKPSQVSKGVAIKPVRRLQNDDHSSSSPSVQSGYSLYSADSETTNMEVHRGLNRCANLLANILSEDQPATVTGKATYKHTVQKPHSRDKTSKKSTQRQEVKKHSGHPRTKLPQSKNPGRKDTAIVTKQDAAIQRSSRKTEVSHVIPTAKDSSASVQGKAVTQSSRVGIAPGFQNLISSTPEERVSPLKFTSGRQLQQPTSGHTPTDQKSTDRFPDYDKAVDALPEPDRDRLRRYDEAMAKQTMHERMSGDGLCSTVKVVSTPTGQQADRFPAGDVTPRLDSSQDDSEGRLTPKQGALANSQGLLRDLVQQLTVLNQNGTKAVGSTQGLLHDSSSGGGYVQQPQSHPTRDTGGMNTGSSAQSPEPATSDTPAAKIYSGQQWVPNRDPGEPSLNQLLSEFRQGAVERRNSEFERDEPQIERLSKSAVVNPPGLSHVKDSTQAFMGNRIGGIIPNPGIDCLTPKKVSELVGNGAKLDQVSTPAVHRAAGTTGLDYDKHYYQDVGLSDPPDSKVSIPLPKTHTLPVDLRGTAMKQTTLQQVKTLRYLLGELQSILADHADIGVSHLLSELEEACNMLPYTTQKHLLDLNTDIHLALQPLQAENSQLRRRLRIANHQLKTREIAERELKESSSISLEVLTMKALNANLQKQLREAEWERAGSLKKELEMTRSLDERQRQHQDMLRVLEEKDTMLLKSRQDSLKEVEILRSERDDLQSQMDYLRLQVEGASKETRTLLLTLEQRDNEITRLKSHLQILESQTRRLKEEKNPIETSPKMTGGISLQRMNKLLAERGSLDKENRMPSDPPIRSPSTSPHPRPRSASHSGRFQKSPPQMNTSMIRRVTFAENPTPGDLGVVGEWARTDTLLKGQQGHTGDKFDDSVVRHKSEGGAPDWKGEASTVHDRRRTPDQQALPKVNLGSPFEPLGGESSVTPHAPRGAYSGSLVSLQPQASYLFHEAWSEDLNGRGRFDEMAKQETASVISDITTTTVTSQYEAHFQLGLRNLDAEIGKLQASLKYPGGLKS